MKRIELDTPTIAREMPNHVLHYYSDAGTVHYEVDEADPVWPGGVDTMKVSVGAKSEQKLFAGGKAGMSLIALTAWANEIMEPPTYTSD